MTDQSQINNMAVFCDFENVALGVRDAKYAHFDINRVLERLLVKGSIVVKKAYCDWERYREYKRVMHEANFELLDIPHVRQSGKNSADIRMVVDALDLCYTKSHVDAFVVVSGDSDFSPLVSKLRENNKIVIGVGVKKSTSDLLIANCDEFIYYDDLVREDEKRRGKKKKRRRAGGESRGSIRAEGHEAAEASRGVEITGPTDVAELPEAADVVEVVEAGEEKDDDKAEDRMQQAFDLVLSTAEALAAERGEEDKVWGSMIKQALKRRKPGFNESYYGFRSFNKLLEAARDRGLIELELDEKSGGYVVRELQD